MKDNTIGVLIWVSAILAVWGMGWLVSNSMSEHEVIKPADGVECVVVSRMFNTSVDCWRVE
jgi:hypothetical protein